MTTSLDYDLISHAAWTTGMHPGQEQRPLGLAAFDSGRREWQIVADESLPPFEDGTPHVIDLAGVSARCVRVVCDREHPVAGMEVVEEPHQITYSSPHLRVSFSLRRPMIVAMGWARTTLP